MKEKKLLI